jgi:hypothetical protein
MSSYTVHYRLGDTLEINSTLIESARFQDRLLERMGAGHTSFLDTRTVAGRSNMKELRRMRPLFISYFVQTMTPEQQAGFFSRYGIREMRSIRSPALRFRLASSAVSALRETNPRLAGQFGRLALTSLGQVASGSAAEQSRLPAGAFLESTLDIIDVVRGTRGGNELIRSSNVWLFVPYIASRSKSEISPDVASRARDFLVSFYQANPRVFRRVASRNSAGIINYTAGLLSMATRAGMNPESEQALQGLYGALGIDRRALLSILETNAESTATASPMEISAFMGRSDSMMLLERNFLFFARSVLSGRYDENAHKIRAASYSGVNSIIWQSVRRAFAQRGSMRSFMVAGGPFSRAARRGGLI